MIEVDPGPFMTNITHERIPDVVPDGLGIEDLSGWELLLWAEGNFPLVLARNATEGKALADTIYSLCNQQIRAAEELELRVDATTYITTRNILRSFFARSFDQRTLRSVS
jgi:hypothetical protein